MIKRLRESGKIEETRVRVKRRERTRVREKDREKVRQRGKT